MPSRSVVHVVALGAVLLATAVAAAFVDEHAAEEPDLGTDDE